MRERRLLQSNATTEARELLTELLEIAYSGGKTQEEALALLGAQISKTASYICRSPCFASRARTRRHRLSILRVRARAINIPRRHIRVSLVPRPLSRFYVVPGSGRFTQCRVDLISAISNLDDYCHEEIPFLLVGWAWAHNNWFSYEEKRRACPHFARVSTRSARGGECHAMQGICISAKTLPLEPGYPKTKSPISRGTLHITRWQE